VNHLIDVKKFSKELYEEFLEKHPMLQDEESSLAPLAKIFADIAAMAIEKYDREKFR